MTNPMVVTVCVDSSSKSWGAPTTPHSGNKSEPARRTRSSTGRAGKRRHVAPRPIGARFAMLGLCCGGRMDLLPDVNGRA